MLKIDEVHQEDVASLKVVRDELREKYSTKSSTLLAECNMVHKDGSLLEGSIKCHHYRHQRGSPGGEAREGGGGRRKRKKGVVHLRRAPLTFVRLIIKVFTARPTVTSAKLWPSQRSGSLSQETLAFVETKTDLLLCRLYIHTLSEVVLFPLAGRVLTVSWRTSLGLQKPLKAVLQQRQGRLHIFCLLEDNPNNVDTAVGR